MYFLQRRKDKNHIFIAYPDLSSWGSSRNQKNYWEKYNWFIKEKKYTNSFRLEIMYE